MKDRLDNRHPHIQIGVAKAEFDKKVWESTKGVICPICERSSRVVPKTICSTQAQTLIWLYWNTVEHQYIHLNKNAPRVLVKNAETGKLKHWGLIEQMPNDDPTKLKSGWVRITSAGRAFVEGKAKTYKTLFIMNDTVLGEPLEKERIDIQDALGKKFDIRDLMRSAEKLI